MSIKHIRVKETTYHFVPSGASGAGKTTVEGSTRDFTAQALTSVRVRVLPGSKGRLRLVEDLCERTRIMNVSIEVEEESGTR